MCVYAPTACVHPCVCGGSTCRLSEPVNARAAVHVGTALPRLAVIVTEACREASARISRTAGGHDVTTTTTCAHDDQTTASKLDATPRTGHGKVIVRDGNRHVDGVRPSGARVV